jgi:hypothetical protein
MKPGAALGLLLVSGFLMVFCLASPEAPQEMVELSSSSEVVVHPLQGKQPQDHEWVGWQRKAVQIAQDLQLHSDHRDAIAKLARTVPAAAPRREKGKLSGESFLELSEKIPDETVPAAKGLEQAVSSGNKQLGAIIGEALASQGASGEATGIDIQPIMVAITDLELKIKAERQDDSDHHEEVMEACHDTETKLAAVMTRCETEEKENNTKNQQNRALRMTARADLKTSIALERAIEKILHTVRTEKRIELEQYYVRRMQRRKDIRILNKALTLVCTFQSFQDDARCVNYQLTLAVADPTAGSLFTDKQLSELTAEHDKFISDQASTWATQTATDNANIAAGTDISGYIHTIPQMKQEATSLLQLAQGSYQARNMVQKLLDDRDASDEAASSVRSVLLAVDAGDYDTTMSLLQLVLDIIADITAKQAKDKVDTDKSQAAKQATLIAQEIARQEEMRKQRQLKIDIATYSNNIDAAVNAFWTAVSESNTAKLTREQNHAVCEEQRRGYRARKIRQDQDLQNIAKLRSLLRVLDGSAGPPDCSATRMADCTSAAQGMCIYKDATASVCACEPNIYGDACNYKKCPGHTDPGKPTVMYMADESGVCTSSDRGTCDRSTGLCVCDSSFENDVLLACEKVKVCPGGGTCSNHGECDKFKNTCKCAYGWFGLGCDQKKCVGEGPSSVLYTPRDQEVCSGHGICTTTGDNAGHCACFESYAGAKCDTRVCQDNCNDRGTCNTETAICACNSGFAGDACEAVECPGNCGGGVGGTCDSSSGVCICRPGYSGPDCKASTTCDAEETTYRDWAMFRKGWSKCPYGSLMTGMKRGGCNGAHCLDSAMCAKPCHGDKRMGLLHCYQADWWSALDKEGVGMCDDGYYMAGLYRNNCMSLYCIEMAWCCSIVTSGWDSTTCGHKDWYSSISKDNTWATVPANRFMTGIGRRGISTTLDDMRDVHFCNYKRTDGF